MKEFVYPRRTPVIIPPPPTVRSSNIGGSTSYTFSMLEENSVIAPFMIYPIAICSFYRISDETEMPTNHSGSTKVFFDNGQFFP